MEIHGFNKTTLLDYPEHIAATVFTGGCNFRCPFCHNGELVLDPGCQPLIPEEEVLAYLKKRQGILQGVCVTGGEPTLQKDLKDFLRKIKELGYPIKLDTNGYMPGVLWDLMQEHLIDYVAMDIKASRDNYARAAGLPHMDISRIEESIGILKSSGIPYEFRTTVVRGIHTVVEFEKIGKWIAAQTNPQITGSAEFKEVIETHNNIHKYATLSWEARDREDIQGAMDYFQQTYDAFYVYKRAVENLQKLLARLGETDKTKIVVFTN